MTIDNRGIHEEPTSRAVKAERSHISKDMEDVCRQVLAELRARGHEVRSVEITAWRNQREEIGHFHLISLPKVEITQ